MKNDAGSPGGGRDIWDPKAVSSRRSLTLCGAAALLGLLIAGFGLFTARGTRTAQIPPEDAALVNGVPILMVDLIDQLRTLNNVTLSHATVPQKEAALNAMIRDELYVQRGVEIGLPADDVDVRAALVAAAEGQVASDALTAVPPDTELRAWYDNHRERFATQGFMELQEFVLSPTQAPGANDIVASLKRGTSPASVGLKSSGRVDDGQEFYFAAEDHLGARLFNLARGMHDAEVSPPIVQPDGVHILVMKHNQAPIPTNYEQARPQVLNDYISDRVARLQTANERFLRKRADVKVAPSLL